jgi:hypothetical protein
MQTQTCGLPSDTRNRTEGFSNTDCYVPCGRIGRLDMSGGCYTAYEVFQLAARDLVARDLESGVQALLQSGRHTVRDFLNHAYGCLLGPREYFTPSHLTGAQADAKDFLRILARASRSRTRASKHSH